MSAAEEEGTGGALASNAELIAQFQTTRVRSFWTYKRIFQLTKSKALTLDPGPFSVTNTFVYKNISKLYTDEKNADQFNLEYEKTTYVYKTVYRAQLLCQLFECIAKEVPDKFKTAGPIRAQRVRKSGSRVDCNLSIAPYGLVEMDQTMQILQEYKWVNVSRIGTDDNIRAFFFQSSGRTKIFLVEDVEKMVNSSKFQLKLVGLDNVPFIRNHDLQGVITQRTSAYSSIPAAVSIFDVNKMTRRSMRPVPRQMHISEEFIVEKDASGFQYASFQRIDNVYALVRHWNNPREFSIEYNDGSSRSYTCAQRDTLLAMLLDVCHAASNTRVIVTGEVSDGLRLMPRFAEEEYESSIRDAFFGASSIEAWFLTRLSKACKAVPLNPEEVEKASRELNANVPCPGIAPNSDGNLVKTSLAGVMRSLNSALITFYNDDRADNSRAICAMLQTLYRIIPSIHGFKGFAEVKEVDTRQLLLQLLKFEHDFVNYWTLEVMMALCRCPLEPRNMQQEFVNKHTILTDNMLNCLIGLMSLRSHHEDTGVSAALEAAEIAKRQLQNALEVEDVRNGGDEEDKSGGSQKVTANPTTFAHIPQGSAAAAKEASAQLLSNQEEEIAVANASDLVNFVPNSLVVIGAAALLESLISSSKDTSSPELVNSILNVMAEKSEVLISMLRSNSFLIMENAAILMYVLTKNRPATETLLKELALSECLVLKHFYNGVFSPSATQRFISRFLITTWVTGPARGNPAKALLLRMIPSGLAEYLKFNAITEEHRQNLDNLEDEFYASFVNAASIRNGPALLESGGAARAVQSNASKMQARMRKRIANAIRDSAVDRPGTVLGVSGTVVAGGGGEGGDSNSNALSPMKTPLGGGLISPIAVAPIKRENFRIMFHVMTQDHKLPDLIWNEQTRLELRSTLEAEIKEFEREQRLLGSKKIAWNYQQFSVMYDSLRDEMQVGPIYVRYFLDAGETFLRQLENPKHDVLFEKLFRRMLVTVDSNAPISILCTRCMSRLYRVCKDIIGHFDDMLIMVRMLEQASNLELQHCLLDLLVQLSAEQANLEQLLDKKFVKTIIKYASLAHINPDQIGNVLARATTNLLMIKDAGGARADSDDEGAAPPTVFAMGNDGAGVPVAGSTTGTSGAETNEAASAEEEQEALGRKLKRSLWVPDDAACPKTWYVAAKGSGFPPPKNLQKGPYRVTELMVEYDKGRVTEDSLVAPISTDEADDTRFDSIVDTGRWKTLGSYFQLRLQMMYPGKAIYSPAEVAVKSLRLLRRLAAVHRSANSKGVPFYPNPLSKRIMSDPEQLAIFAQLLLSNDGGVVETTADLIRSLVEYNSTANSKLYLTGAFFFGCRYTGNNFSPLAKLFASTHLRQSFQDSAASVAREQHVSQRSVLNSILPQAMICMLHNYGAERFSAVFTGEYDTPEVIWNADLRKHMVEMIEQHIGDFPARLRQHALAVFEYVPIPKVHYATLDKEIYVYEYYLKNLCDEIRFPDWPIGEPLVLLREAIERWRNEMSKGVVDNSAEDAKKLLELPEKFENKELRKAYKNLARKFHPDRNPNGREMFEKIHIAYELLSSIELQVTRTDMLNVVLLMKVQNIVYRRFPTKIANQKYPAYALLISIVTVPAAGTLVTGTAADVLTAGTMLMYYTTNVSPLNAAEFVKEDAVQRLFELISYALTIIHHSPEGQATASLLLTFGLKTLTSISNMEEGREAILKLCPKFTEDMYTVLSLDKMVPLAAENCIEVIARCCASAELQKAFVAAGVIWRLIPLLLAYDNTLKDDYADETQRTTHNQTAANMHAIVATKALGRLGGYMFDELASPVNEDVKDALSCLLTQPLAKLLRNRRPWELLEALNENCEKTSKIWNVGMRNELLTFVQKSDQQRAPGSCETDLTAARSFAYQSLKEELCIGGVYVRIFNKTTETSDIDDPSKFCKEMVAYVWQRVQPVAGGNRFAPTAGIERLHMDYTVEALRSLAEAQAYIAHDVAAAPHGIETCFLLLSQPPNSATFSSACKFLGILVTVPEFVVAVSKHTPPVAWRLLKCLCTVEVADVSHAWAAAENMAAHPDGLNALLEAGAVVQVLGTLLAVKGYTNIYQSRLSAIALLSKFLWNPVKGGDASSMLRRMLPEPVVILLRNKAGNASLQVLDTISETPELIWTAEMQGELRGALLELLCGPGGNTTPNERSSSPTPTYDDPFSKPIVLSPDYAVRYRQIANEIYLGGVYIRLYLKQPTFKLSNAVLFTEKLVEFWESSFSIQVPPTVGNNRLGANSNSASDSRAVVLGNEDFIGLLTSCVVCVIKSEPTVVDHLLAWGYVQNLTALLKRALDQGRRGTPMVCVVRLLSQLIGRVNCLDNLASAKVDLIEQLTNALKDGDGVPKDAVIIVELLKKIFQTPFCRYMDQFVRMAMQAQLPALVLNKILGVAPSSLSHISNNGAAALRIHAVDLLKALLAAGDENVQAQLQALLDLHPAWKEFKHQSHDLFLTDKEKTDIYLIQDAQDSKFAGLLTNGPASDGKSFSEMFNNLPGNSAPANNTEGFKISASPFAPKPVVAAASVPVASVPSAPGQMNRPPSQRVATGGATPISAPSHVASSVPPSARRPSATTTSAPPSAPSSASSSSKQLPVPPPPVSAPIVASSATTSTSNSSLNDIDDGPAPPPAAASARATPIQVITSVVKGELGIGLDLGKTTGGQGTVLRFKEFPENVVNPATLCQPSIRIGDVIVGVNGVAVASLSECVKIIRAAEGAIQLTLQREA